jgi:hypothetical protein
MLPNVVESVSARHENKGGKRRVPVAFIREWSIDALHGFGRPRQQTVLGYGMSGSIWHLSFRAQREIWIPEEPAATDAGKISPFGRNETRAVVREATAAMRGV